MPMRPPLAEQTCLPSCSGRLDASPSSIAGAGHRSGCNTLIRRRAGRHRHLLVLTAASGLLSYGESGRDRDANGRQPLSSDGLRAGNGFAAKSKEAVRAAAQRWRQPFEQDSKHSKSHKEEGLPASLFAPYKGELPVDGKTLTEKEEFCDPMERNCQTPMHVWESKCTACYGSGTVSFSSRRGRRTSATCASCTGMGFVRRTSSRLIPDLNGQHMTIGRPIDLDEEEYEEYMRSLNNGKRK